MRKEPSQQTLAEMARGAEQLAYHQRVADLSNLLRSGVIRVVNIDASTCGRQHLALFIGETYICTVDSLAADYPNEITMAAVYLALAAITGSVVVDSTDSKRWWHDEVWRTSRGLENGDKPTVPRHVAGAAASGATMALGAQPQAKRSRVPTDRD